jgi:hypothetical protein
MSLDAELLLVITHLIRAEERARIFGHPKEEIDTLALLRRAAAKVRQDICAKAARN